MIAVLSSLQTVRSPLLSIRERPSLSQSQFSHCQSLSDAAANEECDKKLLSSSVPAHAQFFIEMKYFNTMSGSKWTEIFIYILLDL